MSSQNRTNSGFDDGTLWGPQSGDSFDFTPRFEQTVFTLIPSCVLIACSPYYVWKIFNGSRLVKWGYLFWLKLTTSLILLACEIALAITGQMLSPFCTVLGLASSTIACLSAVCVLVIICAEHSYSIHPSHLLGLFLAITALLDSAIAYSLFRHNVLVQGSLAAAVVAAKALLLCLEEISKRRLFINVDLKKETGREATSGFWGKAFYVWLNATFWKGYKSTLTLDDLDQLDKNLKTQQLCNAFRDHWSKALSATGNSHHRLLLCLLKTIGPMHLAINAIVCLLSVASKFAQPFIIQKVVAAMVEPDLDYNVRASLIGATVLAYFSFAVTRVVNQQLLARSTITLRSCSIVVIFEKLMTLDANTVRQSGVMTLITADVTGFQALPLRINNMISYVASIAGGMAYLALNIGEAAVLVVIPIFACSIVSYVLVKRIKDAQQKWNLKMESRVAAIQTMLQHFKSMKMIGLSGWFFRFINDNLKVEIDASRKLRHYNSIVFGLDLTSIALTPVIVLLGTYCWTRQDGLATADVYALLAVSSMIADPLGQLVQVFSQIARPLACHDRIQKFLVLDNLVDMRSRPGVEDGSQVVSEKMATTAAYIELEAAAATMQGLDTTPLVDGRQILQAVDAIFPKGDVGSGKSTVLRLLLGEVAASKGRVQIDKSTTGFCGQVPWLYNQSVKDNIIGPNPYADEWYKTVTSACGLTADFEQWPLGDNTNAGDSGSSLSGGQKQRISLARAIYARKPLLLLDDVLSGLDAQTAHRIFDALLGKAGILRRSNTTVILATNLAEYLPSADLVLCIDGKAIISKPNACPSTENMSRKVETQINSDSSMASSKEFVEKVASSPQATDVSVTLHDLRETGLNFKAKVRKERSAHSSYFQSFGVVRITIWLILAAFGELFFKTPNIFLRLWFQDHESSDKRFLIGYSVISIFAILFCAIYIWWFLAGLIANSYQQLHDTLLQATLRSTSRFIAATGAGSILNRFSQDVGFISQDLPYAFLHAMMCKSIASVKGNIPRANCRHRYLCFGSRPWNHRQRR
ncbi:hypothetical protein VHEMI05496 [[Torrubiella] hemipterigena]|uniref:ABC transporter n=1 Tax=[Torrubiella] hemipterigena TaxID=1531966 RepID=A0A0A1T4G1_9HYPO|nr:hypothetical protein VHEMI05496 [[Torrubiella] hemipterigena]